MSMPTDHVGRPIDFGRSVGDYERYRPGFPESLFDRLVDIGWIADGMRGLDLGTGTGTGTVALGCASRGVDMIGLDISSELLDVAARQAEGLGLDVEFVVGRAEQTGLAAGRFDVVTAGQSWWWFDSDAAHVEARRVLVSGGRLIICNFSYLPLPGNVAARTEDLVLEHNPGWPKAGWRGVHPEQVRGLDEAGFEEVESFSYVVAVPFSHTSWRGRMRTCNGVGSALEADAVQRFDADLAGMLAAEFPGDLIVPHRIFASSGIRS